MNTYFCDNEKLQTDYTFHEKWDVIEIKGVSYQVLNVQWVGAFNYAITLAPVARLSQYVN